MKRMRFAWGVLALACLASSACQDRREPVKPTVAAPASGPQAAA